MSRDNAGLDALFQAAESPAWQDLMAAGEVAAPIKQTVTAEAYAATFNTPAGRAVLEDMYNRYVNLTRCVPGQGVEAAFYREGMAQVVFDIVHNINTAQEGTNRDQKE